MTATKTKFDIIFDAAIGRYEEKTGVPLDKSLTASLTTVADVQSYVQRENEKFSAFRQRHQKIYDSLNKVLTPIERLGHIAAASTSPGFPPAGACFGAVTLLVKSSRDVADHYDRILELFEKLYVRCSINKWKCA
ncbi:hypothetical protein K505DRAFT_249535 [Melanomma pulvis-pyrius CBS 109.77]|uniref:Fungal STAND N-terminal Goodbye domain-containing protein n=1 Tax=Melanomma pulvis-pyrius CBS 109.77 TaxID=1314802 RepID=A0A6A6X3W4_9PLEO|nr:hypothetical protein K505DRAFT_249535 [Melanomma pulvis-pyrius CBS 109.77]